MVSQVAGRGSDQFVVRLPDGMRDQIAADAKAKGRSMNAEIVARIGNSAPEKTLRDEFAMAALTGIVVANNPKSEIQFKLTAMDAYSIADAMLDARGGDRD